MRASAPISPGHVQPQALVAQAAAALVDFAQGAPTDAAAPGTTCQWLLLKDQNGIRAGAEAYLAALRVAAGGAGTSVLQLWKVASCSIGANGAADVTFHVQLQVPDCSAAGLSPTRPSNIARVGSQLWLRVRWATVASTAITTLRITFGVFEDRPSRVHAYWLAGLRGLDPNTSVGSHSWPPSQQISSHVTFLPVSVRGAQLASITGSASSSSVASGPSLPRKLPPDNTVTVSFALVHVTLPYLLRQLVENATVCSGLSSSDSKYEVYFESTRNVNGLQFPLKLLPAVFIDKRKTVVVAAVEPCLWLSTAADTGNAWDSTVWASTIRVSDCPVLVPTTTATSRVSNSSNLITMSCRRS